MNCSRCRGMMVPDHSYDDLDTMNRDRLHTWRCVLCGDVVDPVILQNRRKQGVVTTATTAPERMLIKTAA